MQFDVGSVYEINNIQFHSILRRALLASQNTFFLIVDKNHYVNSF